MKSCSILMSVYERDNPFFLDDAIASVISQMGGEARFEFVIVKDGPVNTALENTLTKYSIAYPELFKIIALPHNKGLGGALNEGLKNCLYEYVARMDSDDICVNDRFNKQIKYLEENPELSLVGSFVEEFSTTPGDLSRVKKVPIGAQNILKYSRQRNPINHPSVMFRKSVIEKVGSYQDMPLFEDYYLWVRLMHMGFFLDNIPETLLYFRIGNNMVGRRQGVAYLRNEFNFLYSIRKMNFIGQIEFLKLLMLRLPLRLLPEFFLQRIYQLLRK